MTKFFQKIFNRYPIKTKRFLELLPGFFSWTLILFPVWGSILIPYIVAYFILFFDVYWLYKSFSFTIAAFISSRKIKEAENKDWLKAAQVFKNFKLVNHIAIIPNYTESVDTLRRTITSIASQTFPAKQIFVILAMEKREKNVNKKANMLIKEFRKSFGGIFATYHPDIKNEVKGKSSNQSFASKEAYNKLVKNRVRTY